MTSQNNFSIDPNIEELYFIRKRHCLYYFVLNIIMHIFLWILPQGEALRVKLIGDSQNVDLFY